VKENGMGKICRMNAGRKLEKKKWAPGGICPPLPTLEILTDQSELNVKM
jgi:hypothetical protein